MAPSRRTRILIVDDSAVMRSLLRSVVSADAGLEVAGTAADGASALSSLGVVRPDLILLDVEMPVMDGLATLRELRRRGHKMPVIMCSSLTQRGAKVTLDALACGASDYVAKPAGQANREAAIRALGQDLAPKIHALTSQYQSPFPPPSQPDQGATFDSAASDYPGLGSDADVSASRAARACAGHFVQSHGAGRRRIYRRARRAGCAAASIAGQFSAAGVDCAAYAGAIWLKVFAERLDGRCKLRVREAAEGDPVRAGTISIARGNWHMEVLASARSGLPPTLHLTQGTPENHCRPAVDVLFRSVAAVYGAGVLAVVLTGMGSDGMLGCRTIREQGGAVLAQDQASSTVWGMPGAVTNAGLAHRVLSLGDVVPEILRLVSRTHNEARELRESVV